MEANSTLVSVRWTRDIVSSVNQTDRERVPVPQTFNTFQGKTSVMTKPCTGECIVAKICYLRSGSSAVAMQNCPAGFGSVQS